MYTEIEVLRGEDTKVGSGDPDLHSALDGRAEAFSEMACIRLCVCDGGYRRDAWVCQQCAKDCVQLGHVLGVDGESLTTDTEDNDS